MMSSFFGHLMSSLKRFQLQDLVFDVPKIQQNSGYFIFSLCRRRNITYFFLLSKKPFCNPADRCSSKATLLWLDCNHALTRTHHYGIDRGNTGKTAGEAQVSYCVCPDDTSWPWKRSREDKGERKELGVWNKRLIRGKKGDKCCYTHTRAAWTCVLDCCDTTHKVSALLSPSSSSEVPCLCHSHTSAIVLFKSGLFCFLSSCIYFALCNTTLTLFTKFR